MSVPDILWRCLQEFFQSLKWDNFLLDEEESSVPFTITHGDFHAGNVMWMPGDSAFPVRILDWELVGVGHSSRDVGMYIIGGLDHSKYSPDFYENLLRLYHELIKVNPTIKHFSFDVCFRDFLIGGMRTWLFLLPFLSKLIPGDIDFLSNQLESFRAMHNLQPGNLRFPTRQGNPTINLIES